MLDSQINGCMEPILLRVVKLSYVARTQVQVLGAGTCLRVGHLKFTNLRTRGHGNKFIFLLKF